jgi:hypothetical protein
VPYKNKRKQKAAQRKWYRDNKTLCYQRSSQWKKDNPDKVRVSNREYCRKNKKTVRERKRKFQHRQMAELTDSYIVDELYRRGIPPKFSREIPNLIEVVRQHYLMMRLIAKMRKNAKKQEGPKKEKSGVRKGSQRKRPYKGV